MTAPGWAARVRYLREQPDRPLGTTGWLRVLRALIGPSSRVPALVDER